MKAKDFFLKKIVHNSSFKERDLPNSPPDNCHLTSNYFSLFYSSCPLMLQRKAIIQSNGDFLEPYIFNFGQANGLRRMHFS